MPGRQSLSKALWMVDETGGTSHKHSFAGSPAPFGVLPLLTATCHHPARVRR